MLEVRFGQKLVHTFKIFGLLDKFVNLYFAASDGYLTMDFIVDYPGCVALHMSGILPRNRPKNVSR